MSEGEFEGVSTNCPLDQRRRPAVKVTANSASRLSRGTKRAASPRSGNTLWGGHTLPTYSALAPRFLPGAAAPELYVLARQLAEEAELPMPKVFIMDNRQPNAFATGRNPERGHYIRISTGSKSFWAVAPGRLNRRLRAHDRFTDVCKPVRHRELGVRLGHK